MPGVYVAKPEVTTTPDVPGDWDPDWGFPGPFPPGYTPEYSYTLTGPSSMLAADPSAEVSNILYDHETYKTSEPSESITWTAAIEGTAVDLKFSGDPDFSSSISSSYSDQGSGFYGAAPTILFDVGTGDIGSTVVLTASGDLPEGDASATLDILVTAAVVRTILFEVVMTAGGAFPAPGAPYSQYGYGGRLYGHEEASNWSVPWVFVWETCYQFYTPVTWNAGDSQASDIEDFGVYRSIDDGGVEILGTCDEGTLQIIAHRLLEETTYSFDYRIYGTYSNPWSVTFDYTFKVYENGVLQSTTTKQVVKAGGGGQDAQTNWLKVNGSTGEVTVINP